MRFAPKYAPRFLPGSPIVARVSGDWRRFRVVGVADGATDAMFRQLSL